VTTNVSGRRVGRTRKKGWGSISDVRKAPSRGLKESQIWAREKLEEEQEVVRPNPLKEGLRDKPDLDIKRRRTTFGALGEKIYH